MEGKIMTHQEIEIVKLTRETKGGQVIERQACTISIAEINDILTAAHIYNYECLKEEGSEPIDKLIAWNGTFSNKDGEFDVIALNNKISNLKWLNQKQDSIELINQVLKLKS